MRTERAEVAALRREIVSQVLDTYCSSNPDHVISNTEAVRAGRYDPTAIPEDPTTRRLRVQRNADAAEAIAIPPPPCRRRRVTPKTEMDADKKKREEREKRAERYAHEDGRLDDLRDPKKVAAWKAWIAAYNAHLARHGHRHRLFLEWWEETRGAASAYIAWRLRDECWEAEGGRPPPSPSELDVHRKKPHRYRGEGEYETTTSAVPFDAQPLPYAAQQDATPEFTCDQLETLIDVFDNEVVVAREVEAALASGDSRKYDRVGAALDMATFCRPSFADKLATRVAEVYPMFFEIARQRLQGKHNQGVKAKTPQVTALRRWPPDLAAYREVEGRDGTPRYVVMKRLPETVCRKTGEVLRRYGDEVNPRAMKDYLRKPNETRQRTLREMLRLGDRLRKLLSEGGQMTQGGGGTSEGQARGESARVSVSPTCSVKRRKEGEAA